MAQRLQATCSPSLLHGCLVEGSCEFSINCQILFLPYCQSRFGKAICLWRVPKSDCLSKPDGKRIKAGTRQLHKNTLLCWAQTLSCCLFLYLLGYAFICQPRAKDFRLANLKQMKTEHTRHSIMDFCGRLKPWSLNPKSFDKTVAEFCISSSNSFCYTVEVQRLTEEYHSNVLSFLINWH